MYVLMRAAAAAVLHCVYRQDRQTYCCAEMDNAGAMQDVHVHVQRELAVLDQPMSTVGDVAMGLEVTFLNSAVDSVGE